MKLPGPDHPISIVPNKKTVRVTLADKVIAQSSRALTLSEADYKPVQYIPREDADMSLLTRTAHKTHCPYKGDCSYFSITIDGKTAENAVWTYEEPYDAVKEIAGYLAFYPNRVDKIA